MRGSGFSWRLVRLSIEIVEHGEETLPVMVAEHGLPARCDDVACGSRQCADSELIDRLSRALAPPPSRLLSVPGGYVDRALIHFLSPLQRLRPFSLPSMQFFQRDSFYRHASQPPIKDVKTRKGTRRNSTVSAITPVYEACGLCGRWGLTLRSNVHGPNVRPGGTLCPPGRNRRDGRSILRLYGVDQTTGQYRFEIG